MNERELKWQIFRECMQDLRDVERRLRLIGEIMMVEVWWLANEKPYEFRAWGTDLRKRLIYNKSEVTGYDKFNVMELFKE